MEDDGSTPPNGGYLVQDDDATPSDDGYLTEEEGSLFENQEATQAAIRSLFLLT